MPVDLINIGSITPQTSPLVVNGSLNLVGTGVSYLVNGAALITGIGTQHDGTAVGTQPAINLIDTASAEWTITNNTAQNRIDISLAVTGTGYVTDPTTTLGDMLVRGTTAIGRLAVGTNGQVLTANSGAAQGVEWAAPAVSSVFGRTGVVVAANGDYTAAQVTNAVDSTGSYSNPTWITSLDWSKIANAPDQVDDLLTTKGDILGYDTQPTRIPVGTNNQVLMADSTTVPGVKWAAITADLVTLSPAVGTWTTVQAAIGGIDSALSILTRGMAYVGFYDAAAGTATFVPSMSSLDGALPPANATGIEEGDFLIVTTAVASGPLGPLNVGDQLISGGPSGGAAWIVLPIGHSLTSVTAATVPLSPDINSWGTVQGAITSLNTRAQAAGAAGQVQYNAGGTPPAFAASASFTFDSANAKVNVSAATGNPGLHITEATNPHVLDIYVNSVGAQVIGGANTALYIESPTMIEMQTAEIVFEANTSVGPAFQFVTGSSGNALVVLPNGRVGINTATPGYQLDVNGSINCSGTFSVGGVIFAEPGSAHLTNITTISGEDGALVLEGDMLIEGESLKALFARIKELEERLAATL